MLRGEGYKKFISKNSFFPKNHKAQIGETLTWVVATIVIIVILILAIYLSFAYSKTKDLGGGRLKIERGDDLLEMKTSLAHELANDKNKNAIDEWLERENES